MTGFDLGPVALGLKLETLQLIARNIGGGPDEAAPTAPATGAQGPEEAPPAQEEDRPPALSDVAADPAPGTASGTLLGLSRPATEAMRRALAEEIARLMRPDGAAPARAVDEAPRPDGEADAADGGEADEAAFRSTLAALQRRPAAPVAAMSAPLAPPQAAAAEGDAAAAGIPAGQDGGPPLATGDDPAAFPATAPSGATASADPSAATRPGMAADGATLAAARTAAETDGAASPGAASSFADGPLAAGPPADGRAPAEGRAERTHAAGASAPHPAAEGAPPAEAGLRADGAPSLPGPPLDAGSGARDAERAILDALLGEADLAAAFAATGAAAGAMPERAGVIASFILNAAMIPGWPPPRPIEPAALKAFVVSIVGDARLTKEEGELLVYLAHLGLTARQLRRLMRRLIAARNRSTLMLALAAVLTNVKAALSALAEELAALAEEMREEEALALRPAGGRSRLRLR